MCDNLIFRLSTGVAVAVGAVLLGPSAAQAQVAREPKASGSAAFSEAVARAKESSRPLVVFGVAEGCTRCAALKQGLSTQSELKLLMTQYVSVEVPFGGREFAAIFEDIVRQDAKFRQAIGAPSVFIFTAKGDAVYAGPNNANGMLPGDEFKKLLIAGIENNGGLRGAVKSSPANNLATDLAKARKQWGENQPVAAAATISKYVSSDKADGGEVAELVKLTGLNVAQSKMEEQLDSLVEQVSEKGRSLLQAAVTLASTGDATRSAVQLAELDRVFGAYPSFAGKFDAAWKELLAKASVPNLKEQAEAIDKARQAESAAGPDQAIAAYERVSATYPGTKAAELSQLRMTQLRTPKSAVPRLWKSKSGQFSVTATLVAFDGKSAQLRTAEGKAITIALEALSAEDQQFLMSVKAPN